VLTDVDVGTLYYAVHQLAKTGEIASRRSEKVGRGGERTVYRITPKGKKRFQQLLLERFGQEGSVAQTIYPALLFLHLASLKTVSRLLRRRLQQIDLDLTKARAMRDDLGTVLRHRWPLPAGSPDRSTPARSPLVATATY
jgi:DNA-binding PadR family transcriptional regulator